MPVDLSTHHSPITQLFKQPANKEEWEQYRVTQDQVEFFQHQGYLAGLHILDDEQIQTLRAELTELVDPSHAAHNLFYEFHSNESTDPAKVLFHALGAWRIA